MATENKNTVVYGIFSNRIEVDNAIHALRKGGFRNTDVSCLLSENDSGAGGITGPSTGVLIGGALGWLAGMGVLAIPGIGPLVVAGPLVALLAGAGSVGTVGGLTGGLMGMRMPESEAKRYEGYVRRGGILLSVHCDDNAWAKKAKETLELAGAHDVAHTEEALAKVKADEHNRETMRAS